MSPGSETGGAALLGVDVGGTFTDAVLVAGGRIFRAKVPTTRDQSEGVLEAARRVLEHARLSPAEVFSFAHGMTTATNALLERKGARTASVATQGFRDIIEIGRQNRPALYDLCPVRPEPLVPSKLRLTVRERVAPEGEVEPLAVAAAEKLAAELESLAPEAVAVCLLFSFLDPSHERLLADVIRRELPGVHVSLSSEVLPELREYERFSTTAVDAYLTPVVARYLAALGQGAVAAGLPEPVIMQSSGGVLPLKKAAASAAPLLLSGPAGGVVGAVFAGTRSQVDDLIAFDMGGTSTDVTLIREGSAELASGREVGGSPVALPMVDIHTIGAGGGSIAWIDAGGALRVGPESAGADPGPACYGLGGKRATVTDANLCLGYLGERLGGAHGRKLDAERARAALTGIAAELHASIEEAALGIRAVANAEMVKALRVISVERGYDPGQFALVAFGGAGPMHGVDLAEELEMPSVMFPDSCGVLSALGMVVGDERRDWVKTVYSGGEWDARSLAAALKALEEEKSEEAAGDIISYGADLRYRGQSHELAVNLDKGASRDAVVAAFEIEHERAYGFRAAGEPVELINIRLTARRTRQQPRLADDISAVMELPRRKVWFGGEWLEAEVIRRENLSMPAGVKRIAGPVIVEDDEATTVVPPGWEVTIDAAMNLWAKRWSTKSA